MVVFQEMIMGNVPHLGNSAVNAEAKTISREQLLAREDSRQGEEGETRVEPELEGQFKYAAYQALRGHPWQGSM